MKKIVKRKAERHPQSEQVPTKSILSRSRYELDSNPNYNLFNRARLADTKEAFIEASEQFVRTYLDTSAVRGVLSWHLVPRKYFEDKFVFMMKCDFEPKVARISDASSLIKKVEISRQKHEKHSISVYAGRRHDGRA